MSHIIEVLTNNRDSIIVIMAAILGAGFISGAVGVVMAIVWGLFGWRNAP